MKHFKITYHIMNHSFTCECSTVFEASQILYDLGTHDPKALDTSKIDEYIEVKDDGRRVVLCHYPIPCFKNHFHGAYHLYGHVHNSFEWKMIENFKFQMQALYERPCQMFNVGVMMPWMDYTPRTLDEIIAGNGVS